jgi:competence protein ComEC
MDRWMRWLVCVVAIAVTAGACGDGSSSPAAPAGPSPSPSPPADELAVHFLDVGQGDATLLVADDADGSEVAMLVDAGRHDRDDLVPVLDALGLERIDLVVITHGHSDHIGQLPQVLEGFDVDEVWMSGTPHTTRTFERAVSAIEASDAAYAEPRSGDHAYLGPLRIEVLHPVELTGDHHEDSLVVRVVHGEVRVLFTGDAEAATERDLVERHGNGLRAEIYQVGHHGSRTSSNTEFLARVRPRLAVWSAEADNRYGHPHPEATDRLDATGAMILGTAIHGRITVVSDGQDFEVHCPQREGAACAR